MREDVGAILEARAEAHPDRTLFCFYAGDESQRERYSYGSFLRRVNFVARSLAESGIAPGQPALLVYPPGLEMAVAFFACVLIGAVPLPAPPPAQAKRNAGSGRLAHIARHAGAVHVLAPATLAARVASQRARLDDASVVDALSGLRWIATDAMLGELDRFDEQRPSDILFVQYTSGSTSAPRGVAVSHRNVIHNAGLCVDHEQPIGVSWLPHFHDMGLLGYFLFSVIKGGESHCFSPLDFLRRPVVWLSLISRQNATITTAPNTAFEYCLRGDKVSEAQLDGIELGSLRSMVKCAEPVRAGTVERFWRRFSRYGLRKSALVAGYGLAEHTLCVTTGGTRVTNHHGDGEDGGSAGRRRVVSCGRPGADVDVRIVNPDTRRPVPPGGIGEVWIDSPSKGTGYWRLPELSEAHFRARIAGDPSGRGYLRTGDLGFLRDGELYICDRLHDMLVLNGRNVFPADIEAIVEERFARQFAGRVVAFGSRPTEASAEQLVILVEGGTDGPSLKHLRGVVQSGCGVAVGSLARVPRGAIARTSSGKVARRLCRRIWEAEEFQPLEIISAGDHDAGLAVEESIAELVAQAAALGDANATLDQLGLDSIALVNLSLALEGLLEEQGPAASELMEKAADLSLLQALRVSDLRSALDVFRSGTEGTTAMLRLLDATAHKLRQDERDRMSADAALPLAPPANHGAMAAEETLITGATGFLGGFLLRSLVESTDDPVTVARVLGYMIRHGLTVDAPNQVSFVPVDICAHNIVALSRTPDAAAPVLHMTADDHHAIAGICDVIARRFGYRFQTIGLDDFIAHAHAHCRPDDDLYPLLSFFDRNTGRIQRMGDKRYDSSDYRRMRDHDRLALAHPPIEDTVGSIVSYLRREGLIPDAAGASDGSKTTAGAIG